MTILNASVGALRLSLAKGETLIVRNYSGVETVTGSTVSREDASSTLGAGAVVYGPQSVAASVVLSTTGTLDYQTVMGDPTPAVNALVELSGGSPVGLITPDGQPVGGGVVGFAVVPPTRDSLGIEVAVSACVAAGGGTVVYEAEDYTITSDHTLVSGVNHVGVPMQMEFGPADNVPDFWTPSETGTRFNLAAGVTAFKHNAADLGSVQSPLMDYALKQVHIFGIAFIGGKCAIKIGAVNAQGCVDGSIDMVYAYNQTCDDGQAAIDVQNSQFFHFPRLRISNDQAAAIGANFRLAASVPGSVLLPGDCQIGEVFSRCTSRTRKGVVLEAYGATAAILNDVVIGGRIHASRYSTSTPATVSVTTTSGNANINVPDSGQFGICTVGMPIRFQTTAPSGFDATVTYFVVSRDTGAQTVQLSDADYGSATTPTSSATYATYVAGYPTFMARGAAGCAIKNSNFGNLACEVTGNIGAVMFSKTRNCNANLNNPSTSYTGTNLIFRDAEVGLTYSGANNVGVDETSLMGGLCSVTNTAGGAYQHTSGNITLDSAWNGRRVRYSGTSDITITIPRKLPPGFYMELTTTGATGVVTFVGAAGLGLWGKNGLRTNGQYAHVRLAQISALGYNLSGDLQV